MKYENKFNDDEQLIVIPIYWEIADFKSTNEHCKEWDRGLYQVYGRHNAYGQDCLLYIGKTFDQTFSQRLLNDKRIYADFLETTISPEKVRLGRIAKNNKSENERIDEENNNATWRSYINIAEHLLIASHVPALNSQLDYRLSSLSDKYIANKKHVLILNLGDRGDIAPEVSTFFYSYEYYDYETPFGFEKDK